MSWNSPAFAKFASFVLLIYVALFIGYTFRRLGVLRETWTTPIMKSLVMTLDPAIIILSLWTMRVAKLGPLLLIPVAAVCVCISTMFAGRLVSGLHQHNRAQRGAFIACSMFSNNGITLGCFLCLLLLGNRGLSLGVLYALYFAPSFFSVGLLVGQHYGTESKPNLLSIAKAYFTSPISVMPNSAIAIGLILNGLGVAHPAFANKVMSPLVYVDVGVYSIAIGASMHFGRMARFWPECLSMAMIKFFIAPAAGVTIAWLLGLGNIADGLPLKTVYIQASTPVAMYALVLTNLFKLNRDLANAVWLFTTLATIAELPIIVLVLQLFS